MATRSDGMAWLRGRYGPSQGPVHVSRLHAPERAWNRRREWWFEIPEEEIDSHAVVHLLCRREEDPLEFLRLDVPSAFIREHRGHLHFRSNIRKFSL